MRMTRMITSQLTRQAAVPRIDAGVTDPRGLATAAASTRSFSEKAASERPLRPASHLGKERLA